MIQSKYQLLAFDWDGTLMDSKAYIVECVQAAASDLNFPKPDAQFIRQGIGVGFPQQMLRLFPQYSAEDHQRFKKHYEEYYFQKFAHLYPPLFSGAKETLQTLQERGYQLAVATSMSRKGLNSALARYELEEIFTATRCAEETAPKPNPQMLLELAELFALQPSQILMIGDTEYDLLMASNAGMDSVAVTTGGHSAQELQTYQPIACLDQLQDILTLLA